MSYIFFYNTTNDKLRLYDSTEIHKAIYLHKLSEKQSYGIALYPDQSGTSKNYVITHKGQHALKFKLNKNGLIYGLKVINTSFRHSHIKRSLESYYKDNKGYYLIIQK